MKPSSPPPPPKPLDRTRARNAALMNQLATPGLGSLMARRWLAGSGQLLLAVAGFLLIMGWFVQLAMQTYRLLSDLPPQAEAYPGLGKAGAILFGAAWLWSGLTTISLLREARRGDSQLGNSLTS